MYAKISDWFVSARITYCRNKCPKISVWHAFGWLIQVPDTTPLELREREREIFTLTLPTPEYLQKNRIIPLQA